MDVYKRPGGRIYQFRFEYKGEEYRESTRVGDAQQARSIATKRRKAIIDEVEGLTPAPPPAPITATCGELEPLFLKWARRDHPKTADSKDVRVVARFIVEIGGAATLLTAINLTLVDAWRDARLEDGVERSTVNREFNVVRSFLNQGAELFKVASVASERVVDGVLVPGIENLSFDKKKRRVPTQSEFELAMIGLPPAKALMCRVTTETLARLDEVLTLAHHDVGTRAIDRKLKGGGRLRVSVPDGLCTALHALFPNATHIFGDPPPQQEATSSYFRREFDAIGLLDIHHHCFRHLGIQLMKDRGVPGETIMKLAGWTSLRMLKEYGETNDLNAIKAIKGNSAWVAKALERAAVRQQRAERLALVEVV